MQLNTASLVAPQLRPAAAPVASRAPAVSVGDTSRPSLSQHSSLRSLSVVLGGACLAAGSAATRGKRAAHPSKSCAVVRCGRTTMAAGKLETVGIAGCSGAVGVEMLRCLEERDFPCKAVRLFAKRAAGTVVTSKKFGDITVEPFTVEAGQECDILLMAVSGGFSQEYSPKVAGGPKNTVVVDNSSAFRYEKDIPLVIPEINMEAADGATLIANPNCTTAVGAMALWPIHQKYGLKKVLMSTYQAASGAGAEGMAELESGLTAWVKEGSVPKPEVFAHQLPFNVIPQIDAFQTNGYTKEEMKVTWELAKIFGLGEDVKVSCTAVRVPTLRAHSESIVIETEKPVKPEDVQELLKKCPGVKVVDEPSKLSYPMPLNATGNDDVEVGRIRQSIAFGDNGLEFFVSGDQLLRGAALNAVIIAEKVAAQKLEA